MFHEPEIVQTPVVTVSVPLAPPAIVTLATTTVEAFAVRMPPFPTTSAPVESPRLTVASSVVEEPSEADNVPAHWRARVAIVNVCGVPALDVNVTLLNSGSLRLEPAKVTVPPTTEEKVTVPVPASHTAESVESLVQVPDTLHVSLPKSIALAAEEMLTAPVTVTAPEVLVRSPPDIVRAPAASVRVFLAIVPPEIVVVFVTTRSLPRVAVPADTVNALNVLSEDKRVILAVAANV